MDWKNNRILITGGTGSIGRVLTEILFKEYQPKQIVIFSHSEKNQIETCRYFRKKGIIKNIIYNHWTDPILFRQGDISDSQSVELAMMGCNIVIHLAAMKHIDLCEAEPTEAIRVNIVGSKNIWMSAMKHQPEIVLGMSTDKAYREPANFYGYTKAVMEKLFLRGTELSRNETKFCIVRSGNILDSSGSVTQLWRDQVKRGEPITITDPGMTRFFISLPVIARHIIKCIEDILEGIQEKSLYIPRMGSCYIQNLADIFSKKQKIIGKQPYERKHEILDEGYTSDTNKWQLVQDELKAMLEENKKYL